MPKLKLTDITCQNAKRGAKRQEDFFDTDTRGLCLRVSANSKAFYVVYTVPGDIKRAWIKLGRYGDELTLAQARKKAKEFRANITDGGDPAAERKAAAATLTVADLVENYLTRHASKQRSHAEIARRLRKNVSGKDADGKAVENSSAGIIGNVKLSDRLEPRPPRGGCREDHRARLRSAPGRQRMVRNHLRRGDAGKRHQFRHPGRGEQASRQAFRLGNDRDPGSINGGGQCSDHPRFNRGHG